MGLQGQNNQQTKQFLFCVISTAELAFLSSSVAVLFVSSFAVWIVKYEKIQVKAKPEMTNNRVYIFLKAKYFWVFFYDRNTYETVVQEDETYTGMEPRELVFRSQNIMLEILKGGCLCKKLKGSFNILFKMLNLFTIGCFHYFFILHDLRDFVQT